ncbi:MAG TPA: hypothetical protein PLX20_06355 [Rhodocyclaceae bacterium]|nr:hypothetical protein [Rhodocyclaceae bacterium]HMV52532.1 hypothetical protein [Rhodocyclaceae bacterium]HMZ84726.1 hypothetical protein [Rhodocyclaceae bacterium]HNA04454.1 hypothetical protein [Rhodocyclaceae bacterium]HNB80071.1 hypothetical protein [Rhodocyclaceae bacterium]
MRHRNPALLLPLVSLTLLTACEQLGIENPEKVAARKEAESKAIGAACRHAGRAIEDCYALNAKALKAAVFAGWKEMNDYMRDNKIDAVTPQIANAAPATKPAAEGGDGGEHAGAEAPGHGKSSERAEAGPSEGKPGKNGSRSRG